MTLYRIIYFDQDALRNKEKTEPVNFVGSHPLTWHDSDVPEVGFVELTDDEIVDYLAKKNEEMLATVIKLLSK